jgi:hypothetical protein
MGGSVGAVEDPAHTFRTALGRVEGRGGLRKTGKVFAELAQIPDAIIDLPDAIADQVGHMSARRLAPIPDLQHVRQLAQGETYRLACPDECQPVDHRRVVDPVAGRGPLRLRDEAGFLVETDGRGGNPDLSSNFTYLHAQTIALDLQVYLKVYVGRRDLPTPETMTDTTTPPDRASAPDRQSNGYQVEVTLQYFHGCPNREKTSRDLSTLVAEGLKATVAYEPIDNHEAAVERGFRGSPTVLLDGVDPFADRSILVGLTCRLYRTESGLAGSPTLDQLRESITGALANISSHDD